METMETNVLIANIGYLASIILFILGIKRMGKIKLARSANGLAAMAMGIALLSGMVELAPELSQQSYMFILVGAVVGSLIGGTIALRVQMTQMPQMVGLLHSFCGLSSLLIALSLFIEPNAAGVGGTLAEIEMHHSAGIATAFELILSIFVSAITFSGSIIAFLKLAEMMSGKPILFPGRHFINSAVMLAIIVMSFMWMTSVTDPATSMQMCIGITVLSLLIGFLLVIPIGGADMPVVISLLNGYSGIATCITGFVLNSNVLIVSGALVASTGIILTRIMCKAMNRSLANVVFGGFGGDDATGGGGEYKNIKSADAEEAAMDFSDAARVIIVPGYGLAVAQGQNAVREFADELKKRGAEVRYAIHPVAGRMPGHMNVLLAESNVPYDELFEMDEINSDFQNTDVALIIGANDVVNPAAKEDKTSPLYGMPVLNVEDARQVFVIKRGMGAGYAGVKNILFEKDNCRMIFGDAKKVLEALTSELKEDSH